MGTSSDSAFYARTFALLTLLVLGALLYRILAPLFAPLAWAALLAFLLHPLHRYLVRHLGGRNGLSAGLLTLAVLIIVVGPMTAVAAAFATQLGELLELAERLADHTDAPLTQLPVLGPVLDWAREVLGAPPEQLREWASQGTRAVLKFLAGLSGKVFLGAIGRALGFTITLFSLFFFIRDGARMVAGLRRLLPLPVAERERLFGHLAAVTHAVVYGTVLTAVIQGVLVGIGFALVQLPSPLVFGALAILLAILPFLGTPVVWLPAVVALAVDERWPAALFMLGWGIFVATSDNVLRAVLISGRGHIGTLPVFVGVVGGVMAFGMLGLVLGPLLLALAIALGRYAAERNGAGH